MVLATRVFLARVGLLVIVALGMAPLAATASGLTIAWGSDCWDNYPRTLLTSPCNTNTGSATMTVAFVTDEACLVSSFDLTLAASTETYLAPSWWQLGDGQCREGALTASADFRTAPEGGCADLWQGLATGGVVSYATAPHGRSVYVLETTVHYALPQPDTVRAGWVYYACRFTVDFRETVGADSCAGCSTGTVWEPCLMVLTGPDGSQVTIDSNRDYAGNQCAAWQKRIPGLCVGEWAPCGGGGLVPAVTQTWGHIKTLYR